MFSLGNVDKKMTIRVTYSQSHGTQPQEYINWKWIKHASTLFSMCLNEICVIPEMSKCKRSKVFPILIGIEMKDKLREMGVGNGFSCLLNYGTTFVSRLPRYLSTNNLTYLPTNSPPFFSTKYLLHLQYIHRLIDISTDVGSTFSSNFIAIN